MDTTSPILSAIVKEFRKTKQMAERAFEQLDDADFTFRLNADQNSLYVIVKHLSGNMISRWTDFLTSDGEKPGRDRDEEFAEPAGPVFRADVLALWDRGWSCVFSALEGLTDADLGRTVYIRTEPHSVFEAINRQTAHYAYHVGQIVLLAKHVKGPDWKYITIPRGRSDQFNRKMGLQTGTEAGR
jgi:hypothetical protein